MPPPNFVRKKKSHSRGSSAKRASRHRNAARVSSKGDLRSSSVDVASSSNEFNGKDVLQSEESQTVTNSTAIAPQESLVSSLADGVASAVTSTDETNLKDSPLKISPSKKKKSSKRKNKSPVSSQIVKTEDSLPEITMAMEDEKLNNLCKLLDRLDSTYGKSSLQSSSHITKKESHVSPPTNKSFPGQIAAATLVTESNNVVNETQSTNEDKQSLRKAKKEAKKAAKSSMLQLEHLDNDCSASSTLKQETKQISEANHVHAKKESETKGEKSKADLKRERREKQEAQRAAKETAKVSNAVVQKKEAAKIAKIDMPIPSKVGVKKKDPLKPDRHLPLLEHLSTLKPDEHQNIINNPLVHPAIRAAGLCMNERTIDGCISRVLAMLSAVCGLIEDYQTPPSCDLSRDLSDQLSPNISFLNACRPIPEPMNNAIRFVKREINEVKSSIPERQAKQEILDSIQRYIHQNIILASEAIMENALEYIEDKDVILTYGFSRLVFETIKAGTQGKEKLSVVMVDNPGVCSGINLLQEYVDIGIKVHYRILPDMKHIINKVTKVIVEAEAVVLNGAVIGHSGMAGLILMASYHSVPIIVLSHTFKFCNIDLTDSLVVNELGDSSVIVNCESRKYRNHLAGWKDTPSLNVVNLVYDVTPSRLINVLVTERNNYPTSVVPVIIKRNYADILGHD